MPVRFNPTSSGNLIIFKITLPRFCHLDVKNTLFIFFLSETEKKHLANRRLILGRLILKRRLLTWQFVNVSDQFKTCLSDALADPGIEGLVVTVGELTKLQWL